MPTVHDDTRRAALRARIQALRPDSTPRWGQMSVDQMLWHVNQGLRVALGHDAPPPGKAPLPKPIFRFLVLTLPWPKGAPTAPEWVATQRYDFDAERARCLAMLEEVGTRRLDSAWPEHPAFGLMNGRQWSTLEARHLDHHLTQFGV